MAVIYTNCKVLLSTSTATGTRDVSNRVMKLDLPRDADEHDDTVMGLTAHSRVIGLEKWSFKMTMLQSFSTADGGENTNTLLSNMYTQSKAGTKTLMTVSAFGGTSTVSAANPTWSGLVVLKGYSPIVGGVGDLLKTDVEFLGSGNLTEALTTT
jgi:hypothetical protein